MIQISMKNILMSVMLLAAVNSFAQEAGKAGELLKNEASSTDMESVGIRKSGSKNNTFGNPQSGNPNSGNSRIKNPNYQWNQNDGYSEVFLRIPEQGYFTVKLGDQSISNASGKYRFFDLPSGRIPISIYSNGYLMYRTTLNVRNNNRLVLDFFTFEGLYLLDSYPVHNQSYGFNSWNDVWNTPYGNQGNSGNYTGAIDDQTFRQFLETVRKNATFDDNRLAMIQQQARNTSFTARQITELVRAMSFDKNKIAIAKLLYGKCVNKEKYFLVYDAFEFESSKREVMDFVSRY